MTISSETASLRQVAATSRSEPKRRARNRNLGRVEIIGGIAVLAAFVLMSWIAPVITGHAPDATVAAPFRPPSAQFPFGTDALGRDVFVRTFVAVHVDYLVAAVGAIVSLTIGTLLGVTVGASKHRFWGTVMMRVTDALIAVPFPLLILLITLAVGSQTTFFGAAPGVAQILVAIFVVGWAIYARMARAEASGLRSREYITAAELMGYSRPRIVLRHVLPRVLAVTATYAVADAVMIVGFVASLPFLGAGVPPPTAEWGSMMYSARASLVTGWWQLVFPALALTISAVAASIIADALVDRNESRLRREL